MGPTLEETRRDLRYMPTQYLTQVAQSPNDRVIGDIPLKTLAGLELSRRAQMQNELAAMNAPNPQMPTVLDSTVQTLSPQPQQPMPQQGMMPPQQPQQPMPQQGMPPAPPPQQAAPQQPPQPQQQQQQPPQAKQPPIMGLPAMQGPKKMAGGGIIAFAGPEGSEVPKTEEATSALGDMLRSFLRGPEKDGRNAREIENQAAQINPNTWFNLATAMTPSERAARTEKAAALRKEAESIRGTSVPPAVEDDAKKDEGKPKIIRAPNRSSGIADLARMGGGIGGGGGFGGPSREESELRKKILEGLDKQGPAQTEYIANARRMANELETARSPALSEAQREDLEDKQYSKYQARSKPHFDMMQKLLDEERAANNAGKDSEFYQMLGKMGGALMSSRGAFGPALGRAVGEGIDYSDKMDAARATAERLRRSAQMDLLKARMADEKNDQKSAQEYINEHDRKIQAAFKIQQESKIGAMNIRGKMADLEAGDERSRDRVLNQLAIADERSASRAKELALKQELGFARLAAQSAGSGLKGLPTIAEHYKMQEQADALFANPFQGRAAVYLSNAGPEGKNAIRKAEMMGMKPQEALKDPGIAAAVEKAKAAYINDVLRSTNRVNASSSPVRDYNDYAASIGVR